MNSSKIESVYIYMLPQGWPKKKIPLMVCMYITVFRCTHDMCTEIKPLKKRVVLFLANLFVERNSDEFCLDNFCYSSNVVTDDF